MLSRASHLRSIGSRCSDWVRRDGILRGGVRRKPRQRFRMRTSNLQPTEAGIDPSRPLFGRLGRSCALAGLFSCACGLVVDADRFREPVPSNDGTLRIDQVRPARLLEGAGGPAQIGFGEVLVFEGRFPKSFVRLESDDDRLTCGRPQVGARGRLMAVVCWIRADEGLAAGESALVTISVVGAGQRIPVTIALDGLDELELADIVTADGIGGPYSVIVTTAPTVVVGTVAARFLAVHAVRIQHPISASADESTPGPGGELGGQSGMPGAGVRGGAPGASGDNGCPGGGGGGGGIQPGEDGQRDAQGGIADSTPPYDILTRGGHGGGGGGASKESTGRAGGSGGGIITFEAPVIQFVSGARIDATGGDGDDSFAPGCGANAPGAGGGGAGGAIYLKADHVLSGSPVLDVSGGRGGFSWNRRGGGDGAPGWVRVDASLLTGDLTDGVADDFAGNPTRQTSEMTGEGVYWGPSWAFEDPIVGLDAPLPFYGPPNEALRLTFDGRDVGTVVGDGVSETTGPSEVGLHTVCIMLASGTEEDAACRTIAVLPER